MEENELVQKVREGDEEAYNQLLEHYEKKIKGMIIKRHYFAPGKEQEDLVQIGRLGVYKAALQYDEDKGVPFGPFCLMVVKRALMLEIYHSISQKHKVLNDSVSTDKIIDASRFKSGTMMKFADEKGSITQGEELSHMDPYETIRVNEIKDEYFEFLNTKITKKYRYVCYLHFKGLTYQEITDKTGFNKKQIDNALQRYRGKLESLKKELIR